MQKLWKARVQDALHLDIRWLLLLLSRLLEGALSFTLLSLFGYIWRVLLQDQYIYIYCIYNSIKNCRFLLCGRIYGESNETNRWRFILKAQKLIRAVLYQIIYYVCVWHARLSAMKGHDRVPAGDYILIIYILLWMLNMHDEVSKQAKSAASTVSVKCNCFQETEAPPKLLETAQTWKAQPSNYFLGC